MRLVVFLLCARAAYAEVGLLGEGALGTSSTSGFLENGEGGFTARVTLGGRSEHFGIDFMILKAGLGRDDAGSFDAFSFGPMLTLRQKFLAQKLEAPFERWFEVYGRAGPTYTWVLGDPGNGPMDGASGSGFAAGVGVRFVYAAICLSAEITVVHTHVGAAAKHDPADELGVRDVPGVDVHGNITATTFGIGWAL